MSTVLRPTSPTDHGAAVRARAGVAGHEPGPHTDVALDTEAGRPAEHRLAAFLTDRAIEWVGARAATGGPWFAHLSYLRPHPLFSAAGRFGSDQRFGRVAGARGLVS